MNYFIWIIAAFLLPSASADLHCEDFVFGDSATNKGFMFLPEIKGITNGNLTVGKYLHVQQQSPTGHVFALRNCSSNSLSLPTTCVQPDPSGDGAKTYSTTVQVINPDTGHCMTRHPKSYQGIGTNATVNFLPCVANPNDTYQLWSAAQTIYPAAIDPVRIDDLQSLAWEVKSDNYRTVYLNFESEGPVPQVTTLNKTGKVPYSTNIQQCRV